MNNTTKYSDYYQPDNNNIFYNNKCPDFVIPKKKCQNCQKLINYNLFTKNNKNCNKCCKAC